MHVEIAKRKACGICRHLCTHGNRDVRDWFSSTVTVVEFQGHVNRFRAAEDAGLKLQVGERGHALLRLVAIYEQ